MFNSSLTECQNADVGARRIRRWAWLILIFALAACGGTTGTAATASLRAQSTTNAPTPLPTSASATSNPPGITASGVAVIPTPTTMPVQGVTPTSVKSPTHPWAFFGDSITDLSNYPEQVCTAKGCTLLERGSAYPVRPAMSGTTLEYIPQQSLALLSANAAFVSRVGRFPAETLVVLFGTNDYLIAAEHPEYGLTLTTWRQAWELFYAQVAQMTSHPRVIVCGMVYTTGTFNTTRLPVPYGFATPPGAIAAMDAVTKDEALRYGATFVSLVDMAPTMIGSDGVHPNQSGVDFIAQQILRVR